jgi:hypothetical protein
MYKYYLERLSPFKFWEANTLLNLIKEVSNTLSNLARKILTSINLLETIVNSKILKAVEGKPEEKQRKLVEYVFIAHKVLIGAVSVFIIICIAHIC